MARADSSVGSLLSLYLSPGLKAKADPHKQKQKQKDGPLSTK